MYKGASYDSPPFFTSARSICAYPAICSTPKSTRDYSQHGEPTAVLMSVKKFEQLQPSTTDDLSDVFENLYSDDNVPVSSYIE